MFKEVRVVEGETKRRNCKRCKSKSSHNSDNSLISNSNNRSVESHRTLGIKKHFYGDCDPEIQMINCDSSFNPSLKNISPTKLN